MKVPLPFATASAVLAGLLTTWILRDGIRVSPDSWGYWQGSVSLLHGLGYRTFLFSHPIEAWPPLYSIYLAGWQLLLGVSGLALVVSSVFAAAAAAFGWTWLGCEELLGNESTSDNRLHRAALALLSAEFWSIAACWVGSEVLRNALLPFYLLTLLKLRRAPTAPARRQLLLAAALISPLLMLTHTSAATLIVAAASAFVLLSPASLRLRLIAAGVLVVAGVVPSLVSAFLLDQMGSHPVGLGLGNHSWPENTASLLQSIPVLLFGARAPRVLTGLAVLGLLVLAVRSLRRHEPGAPSARFLFLVTLLAGAALVVLFSNVWIADALGGRYVEYFAFVLLLLSLYAASRLRQPRYSLLLTAALVLVPAPRFISAVRLAQELRQQGHPQWITTTTTVSPSYPQGSPVRQGEMTLVAPPVFPWLEERRRALESGKLPPHLVKGSRPYRNLGW